jgi:hypothetical protein
MVDGLAIGNLFYKGRPGGWECRYRKMGMIYTLLNKTPDERGFCFAVIPDDLFVAASCGARRAMRGAGAGLRANGRTHNSQVHQSKHDE